MGVRQRTRRGGKIGTAFNYQPHERLANDMRRTNLYYLETEDLGRTWTNAKHVTANSPYNHTYVRKPLNAHSDFYAFWADGHAREPSPSRLYFCDRTGRNVFRFPVHMTCDTQPPAKVVVERETV